MRKWLAGLFLCSLLLYNGACSYGDAAQEAAGQPSRASFVMELHSGRPLYAYRERDALPMASTTKVMTALLALEYGGLQERVICSANAYGVPGTSIYLGLGESLTLEQMLSGLMLASGNDAAVAIAEHIGGTVEGFAQMMNQRAAELGCENTCFVTPHGLPQSGHYTTARDLTLIAGAAMEIPLFREIVSTQRAKIPWEGRDYDRVLTNKNRLLSDYPGATGIKTGFTRAAGRCLVFGSRREGMELVGVVLNCGDWFNEAERLMDLCYSQYEMVEMLGEEDEIRSVRVEGGVSPSLSCVLAGNLSGPFRKDESPSLVLELPESVTAPVQKGQMIGRALLYSGELLVGQQPILASEAVPGATAKGFLQRLFSRWLLLAGLR